MENLFESQQHLELTLKGKACLGKNTSYIEMNICCDNYVLSRNCQAFNFKNKMKRLFFQFHLRKIRKNKTQNTGDINDVVLSIIDVESENKALKVLSRVPKLFNFKSNLYEILNKYFNDIDIDYIYILQLTSVELESLQVQLFYKHVFVLLMNHCKEG